MTLQYNLSYIIATRNRLPFLKIALEKLINNLQPDEEIVIVDGNSTDGAKEYLQQLFEEAKIHQFISEPDRNQAHGWNKALLMARGVIIKKIIDDDLHSFKAIDKCKAFMLSNPQIDLCISNCLSTDLISPQHIYENNRVKYFIDWKNGLANTFTFSDVYLLIRKSSLSFLGMYDTQFTMIDWEYSLRCSYLKANIAYYTGYNSLSVSTPRNVSSLTNNLTLKREGLIGKNKYGYKGDRSDISFYSEVKIAIGKAINYKSTAFKPITKVTKIPEANKLNDIYTKLYKVLDDYNEAGEFAFLQ